MKRVPGESNQMVVLPKPVLLSHPEIRVKMSPHARFRFEQAIRCDFTYVRDFVSNRRDLRNRELEALLCVRLPFNLDFTCCQTSLTNSSAGS